MKNKDTKEMTARFVESMHEVIKRNKTSGGKIDTIQSFAKSIGQKPSNFSKFNTHGQHVQAHIVIAACKRHKFSPNYLLLGIGEMFLKDDVKGSVDSIDARLKRLEKLLT